jgi:hypothetical protein
MLQAEITKDVRRHNLQITKIGGKYTWVIEAIMYFLE